MDSQSSMPHWLTLEEAAAYLKVSKPTLYRWIAAEHVRAYGLAVGRGYRLKREDLDELLQQPHLSLKELQPRMAEFYVYNGANTEFREVAIMVRDASVGLGGWPRQVVETSIAKAESCNPALTFRGRLIRQARTALTEWVVVRDGRHEVALELGLLVPLAENGRATPEQMDRLREVVAETETWAGIETYDPGTAAWANRAAAVLRAAREYTWEPTQ